MYLEDGGTRSIAGMSKEDGSPAMISIFVALGQEQLANGWLQIFIIIFTEKWQLVYVVMFKFIMVIAGVIRKLAGYKQINKSGASDAPGQYKIWIQLAENIIMVIA